MSDPISSSADTHWQRVLRISGEDRVDFLQGQLTQDLTRLSTDQPALFAASCDPKGRVLAILLLFWRPDEVLACLRHDIADEWVAHVSKYRLRAKVDITAANDLQVRASRKPNTDAIAQWSFANVNEAIVSADVTPEDSDLQDAVWRKTRLQARLAEVGPTTSGKFTPHMLALDELDAISFNKGCYTGQEVVARTEHLGAGKRRVHLLNSTDGSDINEGDSVNGSAGKVGQVAAAAGASALVVMRDSDLDDPELHIDDGPSLIVAG